MKKRILAAKTSCISLLCVLFIVSLQLKAQTVTLKIKDKVYIESYFPSLGEHNPSAGLESSNKVNNFMTNQRWAPRLGRGAKMDARGLITVPAAARPYYKLDDLHLYILPGDELEADLKDCRYPSQVVFSGKNAVANRWLNQKELSVYAPIIDQIGNYEPAQSYHSYELKVLRKVIQLSSALNDLPVNQSFKEDGRIRLAFLTITALMNYVNKDRLMLERSAIEQSEIANNDTAAARQTVKLARAFYTSKHDSVLNDINQLFPVRFLQNYYDFPEVATALESLATFDPALVTERRFPGIGELNYLRTAISFNSDSEAFFYSGKLDTLAQNIQDPALHELVVSWGSAYHDLQPQRQALDFDLEDKDGKHFKLSDFKGKAIYIDFWATWCNPCLSIKPDFEKLATASNQGGILFLSISKDRNKETWRNYLKTHEAPANVRQYVLSDDHELDQLYRLQFIPRFVLIDKAFRFIYSMAPLPAAPGMKQTVEHLATSN